MVLPLGRLHLDGGFDEHTVVLPELGYGFTMSGLELPSEALYRVVSGVFDSLRQDGFRELWLAAAHPQPWARNLPVRLVESRQDPLKLADLTDRLALVPIGHTEQHGFHLPLSTDSLIVEALAQGASRAGDWIVDLPVWPYGVSMHRQEYPGTLTTDPRAFEDLWVELCGALRDRGARMVFLINGHGGNHSFLINAAKFAGERYPDVFVATTYLHTASGPALQQMLAERESNLMGHACELETSYVLALRPDLVHMDRAVDETEFFTTPNYGMDWIEVGALAANPPWSDDTLTGTYGAPSRATQRKGVRWLSAAAEEMGRLCEEVRRQHLARVERRSKGWKPGAWRQVWERLTT